MSKIIPPPPEQPSIEETQEAIRWTWGLMLAFAMLFLGLSQCYHQDALMVEYGRESSHAWVVWKADNLNMKKRREHEGGKIVWLIGSSLIRESFDEQWLNQQLQQSDSPYRVIQFGMDKGNSGIAFGLLHHLDIQEGDIVLHNIALSAFRKDWLKHSGLPAYQLMELYQDEDFWDIQSWTLADKLEQSVAVPRNFYTYHGSYMNGLTNWWVNIVDGDMPKKSVSKHYLNHRRKELQPFAPPSLTSRHYIGVEDFDLSNSQINVQGLQKFQEKVSNVHAELKWLYLPPRQQYMAEMIHPKVVDNFQSYLESWKDSMVYFSQLPELDYYDLSHPNFRGRKSRNQELLQWLESREMGSFPAIEWPMPEYHQNKNTQKH